MFKGQKNKKTYLCHFTILPPRLPAANAVSCDEKITGESLSDSRKRELPTLNTTNFDGGNQCVTTRQKMEYKMILNKNYSYGIF